MPSLGYSLKSAYRSSESIKKESRPEKSMELHGSSKKQQPKGTWIIISFVQFHQK